MLRAAPKPASTEAAHGASSTVCGCIACGGHLRQIDADMSEQLEYVLARFTVIRQVLPKLACLNSAAILQATAPRRPIAHGVTGPALLDPLVTALGRGALTSTEVHAEDRQVPSLDPGRGTIKTGRLRVYVGDDRSARNAEPVYPGSATQPTARAGIREVIKGTTVAACKPMPAEAARSATPRACR